MRFCPSGPVYHLLGQPHQQEHWLYHTNIVRKWRSLSGIIRRIVLVIVAILLIACLGYNVATSNLILHQMKPRVQIHSPERSRCCTTDETGSLDMCGRSDCIWPCPASPTTDYGHLFESQDRDRIFFHETSGSTQLNFRQACVVESMAYRNPNLTVNVLMTGPYVEPNTLTMWNLLENYPNLKITNIHLGDYLAGSALEYWYYCTEWYRGWFAVPHLSDALRFYSLSKYGGYYFDLDIIQLRPLTSSFRNFIVPEDMTKLGSSVIHADYPHPIMQTAVEDFAADYKWYIWAHNGPELITRVLQRWCHVYYISWMTPERCRGFKVVSPRTFYPLHYTRWKEYFERRGQDAQNEMDSWDESVIGTHIWNSLSGQWTVKKQSDQLYVHIAKTSCPRIFQAAPDEF